MAEQPVSRHRNGRVVVVTGAHPPDVCGVGTYTERLMAAAPPHWSLFVERDWSPGAAPGILRRLLRRRPGTVILQYPTENYGWSLVPHLLVAFGRLTGRWSTILALHEFTSLTRKSRTALALASRFARGIVFTTQAEREAALAHALFAARAPTRVVPILSNIPFTPAPRPFEQRSIELAYFGHIRPNKGLEAFLATIGRLRSQDGGRTRVAMVGMVPAGYESFGDSIAAGCRAVGCELILDRDESTVAALLNDIRILYLPFPDGVSARRGSVLAGFGNGALVAAPLGPATPPALAPAVIPCTGAPEDADILRAALAMPVERAAALQRAGRDYIATILPRDWAEVAALYQQAVDA